MRVSQCLLKTDKALHLCATIMAGADLCCEVDSNRIVLWMSRLLLRC